MADETTPNRINVSRDALRADLAEMELRLRVYFDNQLQHKADKSELAGLIVRVNDLEKSRQARDRGDFTHAQSRAIASLAQEQADLRTDRGWTSRERAFAVVGLFITLSALALSAFSAFHGGG